MQGLHRVENRKLTLTKYVSSNITKAPVKPDIVGKRIELILTNDLSTDLKPGDRGTVVDITSHHMNICLSRFGFSGMVARDLQS